MREPRIGDERYVVGHAQPFLIHGLQGGGGGVVVDGEEGRRRVRERQQVQRGRVRVLESWTAGVD